VNCARRICALLLLVMASAGLSWGATPQECHALRKHGRRAEARSCYQTLSISQDRYLRAEGYWGLEMYQEANSEFRALVDQSSNNAMYRVRWGRLMHERFNNIDAEKLFQEALKIDPKNAQAFLGLAIVSADGFDSKAPAWAKKALEADPKLVEAHELLADLSLEDSNPEQAVARADEALKLSPEALDAMAIHAAVEVLADRPPDEWIDKIKKVNPVYGEGYAIVAHHLILNRRYEDGIAYYRKAIDADPRLWSARSQLGINLMRLGLEEEPQKQLAMCYDNGYRDAATVNTLRLLDSYKNMVTLKTPTTILKFNKKEADLLHPYFQQVLDQTIADFDKTYKMKLPGPVQVEVYPDQQDFAVRALGMPGLGALGVTFGNVVAMDSPSAGEPGTFHWASTLRHEMSHVYVLLATNFRVPRWFTEGLAVHEETVASPEWGDRVTPDILVAVRDKKLLPVAELDRGFIRPEYESQVIVSYFQAGRICDYIQSRWGADKLLDMVHSFAQRKTTREVFQTNLGMTTEEFDRQFIEWLYKSVGQTANNFDDWRNGLKKLADLAKNQKHDEVIEVGEQVRRLYPDYIYAANAYQFLADAYLAKNNKTSAIAVLSDYEKLGGRSPDALRQLATLQEEAGKKQDAAETLDRINYFYPVHDESLHRHLGDLWFELKNYPGAIREYTAVVALSPLDRASAEFNLARAFLAAGQREQASQHVLAALEVAPGYRPAQRLLLQLNEGN
jgi:cellulose synthase operon protein C